MVSIIKGGDSEDDQHELSQVIEQHSKENKKKTKKLKKIKSKSVAEEPEEEIVEKNIEIVPSVVVQLPKQNSSNNREQSEAHKLTISEAFADDDVIEEFKAEKVSLINY